MQATGNRRRILLNLSSIAGERVVQIALGILINALLARYLSTADFGRWQYAQTVLVIVLSLTWVCGNEILVPRLVASTAAQGDSVLWHFFVIRLASASLVAAGFLAAVVLFVTDERLRGLLLGLTALILLKEPFLVILAWLQSQTRVQPALVINVLALLFKAGLVAGLIALQRPLSDFAWVLVAEAALISLGLSLYYLRRRRPALALNREDLKGYLRSGLTLWVSLLLMYVFARVDRLVLQQVVGFADYALYATAAQLNENWLAITGLVTQSLAPIMIYSVVGQATLRRNLGRALLVMTGVALAGGAALYALAPLLFVRIFGEDYAGSQQVFRWIIWLSVLGGLDAVLNLILIKYGRLGWLTLKWLFGTLIMAGASLLLIPQYQAMGAVAASFIGYSAVLLCSAFMVRRIFAESPDTP